MSVHDRNRGAKRIFKSSAVEKWFGYLRREWEPQFTQETLQQARYIYTQGLISEIELGPQDAIIHGSDNQESYYVVIEWLKGCPQIRSSLENEDLRSRSLAAAGIYEIEELITEEITPIAAESKETETEATPQPPPSADTAPPPDRSHPLLLHFKCNHQGLTFRTYWQLNPKRRIAALGNSNQTFQFSESLKTEEREKLIRLTGFARKAEFKYQKDHGSYQLLEAQKVQNFFQKILPSWREHFLIELDDSVQPLLSGIRKVKIAAHLKEAKQGKMDLHWDLSLDGSHLSFEQIRQVRKRGTEAAIIPNLGLVQIDKQENKFLDEWDHIQQSGEKISSGLPKYLLLSLFYHQGLQVVLDPKIANWKKKLERKSTLKNLPDYLRDYQEEGVSWMNHISACECHGLLADEMGLGKTLQCLNLLAARPLAKKNHLIVCPASVVPVWINEINKFFPHWSSQVLYKGNDFVGRKEKTIWIASYTQLRRHKHLLDKAKFGYAILDEAQVIKNPEAKVTQACFSIQAKHRFALTGTPIENQHLDLWSLFRYLMPGLLGSRKLFQDLCEKNDENFQKSLKKQIAPFVLRRTKKEVLKDLPPKTEIRLICPLSDTQRGEYSKLVDEGVRSLGENMEEVMTRKSLNLFTLLTRLRQVCCDPGLLPGTSCDTEHSGKINILLDRLEEALSSGHKVVVFSQFVQFLERVKKACRQQFPQLAIFELNGSTTNRQKPVQAFQEAPQEAIILTSLKAGGTGITLHAADYVFVLDPWWNPAVEEQAIDRVHRMGQKKSVFVYRMVTQGTIEERIQELQTHKKELFDQIVGSLTRTPDFRREFSSLSKLVELKNS